MPKPTWLSSKAGTTSRGGRRRPWRRRWRATSGRSNGIPGFALAYDSLAELHWFLGLLRQRASARRVLRSTWHALRALELDDTLAETHALLGMLRKELDYNWPEVDRELRPGPAS